MNVAGIIAEYNPFHLGHRYQIQEVRKRTGADCIIIALSGDFVQRGEPAIADKYLRTQMALLEGADLVLELPVNYALSSAENFAWGGVTLLASTGVINKLCFGGEAASLSPLLELCHLLKKEPEDHQLRLREGIRQGMSFPAAQARAIAGHHEAGAIAGDLLPLLTAPNNILALEYLRVLADHPEITPVLIPRKGDDYHADEPGSAFASATAVRSMIFQKDHQFEDYIPDDCGRLLGDYLSHQPAIHPDDLSAVIGLRLLLMDRSYILLREPFVGCSRQLTARIHRFLPQYQCFSQFCKLLKTKNTTMSHIRRALLRLLLDLDHPESFRHIPCLRVLGFRKTSGGLLHAIKQNASLPLITKMADAHRRMPREDYALLLEDVTAAGLYQQQISARTGRAPLDDFRRSPVLLR